MLEKRYTVTEAARLSGFSQSKIRSLIKAGKLSAIDTSSGSRPRFEIFESSIYEFLNPKPKSHREEVAK